MTRFLLSKLIAAVFGGCAMIAGTLMFCVGTFLGLERIKGWTFGSGADRDTAIYDTAPGLFMGSTAFFLLAGGLAAYAFWPAALSQVIRRYFVGLDTGLPSAGAAAPRSAAAKASQA